MTKALNGNIHGNFQKNREDIKSRIISLWAGLSVFSVIIIQKIIRPNCLDLSTIGNYLLGTLPNFFSATGLCAIAFINYRLFFRDKNTNTKLSKRIVLTTLFAFSGLTFWEIIQYFLGFPIDYADIFMTAIGCVVTDIFIVIVYKLGPIKSNINSDPN